MLVGLCAKTTSTSDLAFRRFGGRSDCSLKLRRFPLVPKHPICPQTVIAPHLIRMHGRALLTSIVIIGAGWDEWSVA